MSSISLSPQGAAVGESSSSGAAGGDGTVSDGTVWDGTVWVGVADAPSSSPHATSNRAKKPHASASPRFTPGRIASGERLGSGGLGPASRALFGPRAPLNEAAVVRNELHGRAVAGAVTLTHLGEMDARAVSIDGCLEEAARASPGRKKKPELSLSEASKLS